VLEGLDQVAWDQLTHAYGPAADVPPLLRALVDPSTATPQLCAKAERSKRTVRDQVMWELWGNVFHQGTVWEVTPHVVPFLVEIVREGPAEVRAFAIRYLHHLAVGYPQDMFPTLIEPSAYFRLADEPDSEPDNDLSATKMCTFARACYRAVEAALPTLAACASDADDRVALAAISTLASFRSSAPITREVAAAATGRRLAAVLVALAQLEPARTRALAAPLLDAGDREIAIHAAVADVLAGGDDARALALLVAPLEDLTETRSAFADTLGTLVARTLARVPESNVDAVVTALATTLETSNPMTNLATTEVLLRLVFRDQRAPAVASELTARQRTAVAAIAAHGAFQLADSTFGNYTGLLAQRGLPRDAAALTAWLAP